MNTRNSRVFSMYRNVYEKMEPLEKRSEDTQGNTTIPNGMSKAGSSNGSEGSRVSQDGTKENKTVLPVRALSTPGNRLLTNDSFANMPSSLRLAELSEAKSTSTAGMYVKKLPERLQRLQDEKKCPELSVQSFFDFMRTAYQVNDSFDELASTLSARSEIDWTKLAKTDLNLQEQTEAECNNNLESEAGNDDKNTVTNDSKNIEIKRIENEKVMEPTEKCAEDVKNENQNSPTNDNSQSKCRRQNLKKFHQVQRPAAQSASMNDEDPRIDGPCTERQLRENKKSIEQTDQRTESPSKSVKNTKPCPTETVVETKEYLLAKMMKKKLGDILHEGILDSVLPYMLPKPVFSQPVIKKSITNMETKKIALSMSNIDNRTTASAINKERDKEKNKHRRKSIDNEVEIHVCDEAKNIKKDFRCPQKLLVQKMCYFADVTAGQKLEEMDISVHCDIVIFDWLMRWVKKDIIKRSEWPVFEPNNVIPIMVSASFLQMEPLLQDCLIYCHNNMSEILKTSTILTCLNDILLTRLAKLFTNTEVETLKDKKDKVQSRLFCKLIVSLVDDSPDTRRGHYSSLSTLFKCGKCGKNVIRSVSDSVPCIPSAMRLDVKGNLHSLHTRDVTWNLNDYIVSLRGELRSWRRVYWRLWGDCHFLFCRQCCIHFPVHQMDWCCYHPEIPQFFANEQQRSSPFPLGRYPCCSQRAYRFETLPNREGCRFKEHIPAASCDRDVNILNMFSAHRDLIALEPPQLFFPEKITRLVARDPNLDPGKLICKESMWWDGIELVQPRPKLGLLGKIWGGSGLRQSCQTSDGSKSARRVQRQTSQMTDTSSPGSSLAGSDDDDAALGYGDSSIDDDTDNSEESHAWPPLRQIKKFKRKSRYYAAKRSDGGRSWSSNLIVRYNQDNQRDFEEKAALQMATLLTKRTSLKCGSIPRNQSRQHGNPSHHTQPIGGIYVRLEAEFREQLAQSYKCKNTSLTKGSARVKSSKQPQ